MKGRAVRWRPARGRPITFDRATYQQRNVTERAVRWLKEHRRVAMRFEKLALHYLAVLKLAILRKYLRILSHTP